MHIEIINFTPLPAFTGGLLIGLAAALLVLLNGKVAGVSGILAGLFEKVGPNIGWRVSFIAGLIAAPWLYSLFQPLPAVSVNPNLWWLAGAGLLVGFGTSLGSGCTSGHGVCGISRLSMRSLIATLSFMAAGIITVYFTHHVF